MGDRVARTYKELQGNNDSTPKRGRKSFPRLNICNFYLLSPGEATNVFVHFAPEEAIMNRLNLESVRIVDTQKGQHCMESMSCRHESRHQYSNNQVKQLQGMTSRSHTSRRRLHNTPPGRQISIIGATLVSVDSDYQF